jgi:hypothetical protein
MSVSERPVAIDNSTGNTFFHEGLYRYPLACSKFLILDHHLHSPSEKKHH